MDKSPPIIEARQVIMQGTQIEEDSFGEVIANRASNVAQGLPPFDKDRGLKGRIAVVGYGPSLNDTWERLREFDAIWTVSKAHDFLIERGITPTYHMDLDPRPHKAEFLTRITPKVRYFCSTHVHPIYLAKLKAAGVTPQLFHVAIDKAQKLDPRYPAIKVRYDAGLQAAELAFQRGYREQHWFGIDYGKLGGSTHAGLHWGATSKSCSVEVDGQLFESTQLLFHGLLLGEHFLCGRPLVRCTIHGGGLLAKFMRARNRARFSISP